MLTQAQAETLITMGSRRARALQADEGRWWESRTSAYDGPEVVGAEEWTEEQLREAGDLYSQVILIYGGLTAMDAMCRNKRMAEDS